MVFGSNYNLDEMVMLDARMLESLFSFLRLVIQLHVRDDLNGIYVFVGTFCVSVVAAGVV